MVAIVSVRVLCKMPKYCFEDPFTPCTNFLRMALVEQDTASGGGERRIADARGALVQLDDALFGASVYAIELELATGAATGRALTVEEVARRYVRDVLGRSNGVARGIGDRVLRQWGLQSEEQREQEQELQLQELEEPPVLRAG